MNDVERELARHRRLRTRAWIDLAVGIVLVAVGLGTAIHFHDVKHLPMRDALTPFLPALVGIVALFRAVAALFKITAVGKQSPDLPEHRDAPILAIGFKSFIAYRYLMARAHKLSRAIA